MKRSVSAVAAFAAMVLWASAASAQGTQFAGKWSLDMDKTMAANPAMQNMGGGGGGGGGGGRGGFGMGPMTIAVNGDQLSVTRTTQNGENTVTYKLDDSEQTVQQGRGEAKVKAKWESDKSKIVMESKTTGQDGTERVTHTTYSIDGDYLVIETTRPGRDGSPMTSKQYYKKG